MPALTGWHFVLLYPKDYFLASSVAGFVVSAGVVALFSVAAGAEEGIAGVVTALSSITFEPLSLLPPLKLKLDNKIKAINVAPKYQVLLSKKSVVFCTPPIICELPKVEDNPPPLGF